MAQRARASGDAQPEGDVCGVNPREGAWGPSQPGQARERRVAVSPRQEAPDHGGQPQRV